MGKKLFFSLQGVDLNDDKAIEAFAKQVWEQAVAEFGDECRPPRPEESSTKEEGIEQ